MLRGPLTACAPWLRARYKDRWHPGAHSIAPNSTDLTSPLEALVEVAEAADEERDAGEQEEPREERLDRRLRKLGSQR